MRSRQALALGALLVAIGAVVLVLSTLCKGSTTLSCGDVTWVNKSCFKVGAPGILCVSSNASIPNLKEVKPPATCRGGVAYVIRKPGEYCIQQSFRTLPSIKLCTIKEMSGTELAVWVSSSLMVISGLILLYRYITREEGDGVKEEYVVGDGRITCRARSLTRHECRIAGVGDRSPEIIRTISEYLRSALNYRVRDLQEGYAILERGSALGFGRKPVTLLIHAKDNDIILEYSVAPLQASGLYDLREFAEELNLLFENSALRDLLNSSSGKPSE